MLDPPGEALEVVGHVLVGVAAVDEEEGQRCAPVSRHGGRTPHDADDLLLEPGAGDRLAKEGKGVDEVELGVDESRIMPLPAGLVLLRSTVVVDGEHH